MRLRSRLLTLLLTLPSLCATTAFASDLQCATTRQPAERVICDHAILNSEYDDIYAQQQNLLSAGKLSPQDIAGWKQARNACIDVHCIDGVFAQWKTLASNAQAGAAVASSAAEAAPPAVAQLPDTAPGSAVPLASAVLPASEPSPDVAPTASAPSDASQVRQGSAAGIAMPQAVDPSASAAAGASTAPASSEAGGSRMTGIGPGLPVTIVIVLLIAIGAGVFVMRRRTPPR